MTVAARLFAAEIGQKNAPEINVGGVVNSASFTPAPENFVAPLSIVSIFGVDLALRTRAINGNDVVGNRLPDALVGVRVRLGGQSMPLFYVSPLQINAQIPDGVFPRERPWKLEVVREGLNGKAEADVIVKLAAPGLYPVTAFSDFSLIGRGEIEGSRPANPSDVVVVFGTGFGQTIPQTLAGDLPMGQAPVALPSRVFLGGRMIAPESVLYVGQAPTFAGLYQANFVIPADEPAGDPEVFVEIGAERTQPGVRIAVGDT